MKILSQVRTTRTDRPFHSGWAVEGEHGVDLEAVHYVEDEFIVAGTTNTYTYDDTWTRCVCNADVPYTTRILIRRPADITNSSGAVCAEPLHPGSDHDLTWRAIHPWMVRSGHTWMGVSVTPHWTRAMAEEIDTARYGPLSLPQAGLGWGIMSEAVTALRAGVFSGLPADSIARLYLSGWSMTGTFCRVFLGEGFHAESRKPSGGPAIDGYVIGISSGGFIEGGYTPLSSDCPTLPAEDVRRTIGNHGVPVIELLSENEAETHASVMREDGDDAADPYRLYEVAGSGHASNRERSGWPGDDIASLHRLGAEVELVEQWSTFPLEYVARAVFENLDRWVATGTPAPHAARIPYAAEGLRGGWRECRPLARDDDGNATGGVRSTYVDVPIATFVPHSTGVGDPGTWPSGDLYPHVRPFAPEALVERYGSGEAYRELVRRRAKSLVDEGWLLEDEVSLVLAEADQVRFIRKGSISNGKVPA